MARIDLYRLCILFFHLANTVSVSWLYFCDTHFMLILSLAHTFSGSFRSVLLPSVSMCSKTFFTTFNVFVHIGCAFLKWLTRAPWHNSYSNRLLLFIYRTCFIDIIAGCVRAKSQDYTLCSAVVLSNLIEQNCFRFLL